MIRWSRLLNGGAPLLFFLAQVISLRAGDLTGVVKGPNDQPLPGAHVSLRESSREGGRFSTHTDDQGRFLLSQPPPATYHLTITSQGFKTETRLIEIGAQTAAPLFITLTIPTPSEMVTVTATRTEQTVLNIPAGVTLLNAEDLRRSPGQTVDDALRQVPGFSLFRRSSSLASHPTAQGVSLRGIGPSGASRTLVLLDDVPLNDAFGGWVYWSRVPVFNLEGLEIVGGGNSSLYGNYALGGVISLRTRRPDRRMAALRGQMGNQRTAQTEFYIGDKWGRTGVGLQGNIFTTGGFRNIAESERGPIDRRNRAGYGSLNLKLDYDLSSRATVFLDGAFFDERRNNGTQLQRNGTVGKYWAGGARWTTGDGSHWHAVLFSHLQSFNSTFTAIAAGRRSERLTLTQNIPSDGLGGSVLWSKKISAQHQLLAGADYRWVRGESREEIYNPAGTDITLHRVAGGRQRSFGVFLEDIFTPTDRWQFSLSGRFDRWRNFSAAQTDVPATAAPSLRTAFPDKSNNLVNAKVSALYHVSSGMSLWSSFYKAFRAPTLNELYRQFRVGNVVTLANSQLGPERITEGAEIGIKQETGRRLFWSATGFINRVKDPITNVTLIERPTLITRQRQNLGRTRIKGMEIQMDYQPGRRWMFSSRYLFDQAQVMQFEANRALERLFIPQVPRHQSVLQARYTDPKQINWAIWGRFVGRQFDDDLNRLPLDRFLVMDLTADRPINKNLELFLAMENVFNRNYMVGRTPFTTIGSPRRIHGGLRFHVGR